MAAFIATCHTASCRDKDVAKPVTLDSGTQAVICGECGQLITDKTPSGH